ncbi:hypothetical protein CDAR_77611 [Caerostris darwini]|uniref:Uncharacterized protein n=1 Tax=Caerostris darwini TaxID=1538125 RepID=A0AAV4V5S4_9ARAC|nr:hypothetical protein CDAR_77611 [Caerostris darwini]
MLPPPRNLTEWFQIGKTSTNLSPIPSHYWKISRYFPIHFWELSSRLAFVEGNNVGNHKSGEGKLGHSSHWTSPRAMKISVSSPLNNPIRLMAYPLVRKRGWFVSLLLPAIVWR